MSVSSRRWVNGVTLTDSVKEKIRERTCTQEYRGKAFFFLPTKASCGIWLKDTFLHPDVLKPHRFKPHRSKVVLQKQFSSQVGNLGNNGAMCFWVTVIFHKVDQRIITAYPTWKLTNIFYIWWTKVGFMNFANNCNKNIMMLHILSRF